MINLKPILRFNLYFQHLRLVGCFNANRFVLIIDFLIFLINIIVKYINIILDLA